MATTACPRCHYPYAYTTDTSSLGANQDDNPALVLHAGVRRLDDLIARLNADRAILLRRINDTQDLTRNLPPEVLSHIFQFVRPPIDFSTHQVVSYRRDTPESSEDDTYHAEEDYHYSLIAVSRRWREIALSTPHLWTSIALGVTNTPGSIQAQISLLDFHFENAKNIPVSIEVDFRDLELNSRQSSAHRTKTLSFIDPLVMAIILRRSINIRNLLLIHPPIECLTLIDMNFYRCESMTISQPSFEKGWMRELPNFLIDFSALYCVRDVHLIDCTAIIMFPPGMTSCRLRGSHIDTSLELLATYPNFTSFESLEPDGSPNPKPYNLTRLVTLPNLEELTWSCLSADSNNAFTLFLRFIRFSKLRTLEWCDDEQDFPLRSSQLHFFASLPTTLTSITFNQCNYDNGGTIEQLVYNVPQLTELHFIECDTLCVKIIVQFIGRPLLHFEGISLFGYRPVGLNVLPNLRELSIEDPKALDDYEPSEFIDMFRALHARGISERFYLTLSPSIDWDPDSLSEIRDVLSSGFNAKIDLGSCILE